MTTLMLTTFLILIVTTFYHYFIEYEYLIESRVSKSEAIHRCYTSIYVTTILCLFHDLVAEAHPNTPDLSLTQDVDKFAMILQMGYLACLALTVILIALSLKDVILKHIHYKRFIDV